MRRRKVKDIKLGAKGEGELTHQIDPEVLGIRTNEV
jgi:hypothetical protein